MQNKVIEKKMCNYTVYCHRNKINDKYYVGITQQNPTRRWQKGIGYNGQLFGRAIKKYGWDNFEHIILEQNLSFEQAMEQEQYYIQYFNSQLPNGYNISIGGESGAIGISRLFESDDYKRLDAIILETMEIVHGFQAYEKEHNLTIGGISRCCINNQSSEIPYYCCGGLHFMYYDENVDYEKLFQSVKSYVHISSRSNDIIHLNTGKIYKTFYEIHDKMGYLPTDICACCKTQSGNNTRKCDKFYLDANNPQIFMYVKDMKKDVYNELIDRLEFIFKRFKIIRPIRYLKTNEWFLSQVKASEITNIGKSKIMHHLRKDVDNPEWEYIRDIRKWIIEEYLINKKEVIEND